MVFENASIKTHARFKEVVGDPPPGTFIELAVFSPHAQDLSRVGAD
jgi:hypothetical protein